jgi:hypothetical protein
MTDGVTSSQSSLQMARLRSTPRRRLRWRPLWVAAWGGAVVLGFAAAGPALALQCPAPHHIAGPGVLKETPEEIARLSRALSTGDLSINLPMIISDLRARYPGAQAGEIMNYLITAYCTAVARTPGLSESQQQSSMDQFTHLVSGLLF